MNTMRQKQILEILLQEKQIKVKDIAKRLYSSEPSIRRDLTELSNQNLLKRVHGGAILEENSESKQKIPFLIRELEQSDAKILIAEKAAKLVNDGDVIFIDASTSAYNLIPFLTHKKNITVITSGIKAIIKLAEYGINSYSTGGHLLPTSLSLVGEDAHNNIEKYNADISFFSCRGISDDGYVTDFSIEENLVRQKMKKSSKVSVLLCDNNKHGKKYLHNLCDIKTLNYIISETEIIKN